MRRFHGLVAWLVVACLAIGQGVAMAACPMRAQAWVIAADAQTTPQALPCHESQAPTPDPAPGDGHASLCLCALACTALGLAPSPPSVRDAAPAIQVIAPGAVLTAAIKPGLDPPVPRVAA